MANGIILHQQVNILKLHSIDRLCKDLDIRLVPVRPEDYNTPLHILLERAICEQNPLAEEKHLSSFSGAAEMLVLCGLSPDLFDRFLREYRAREIAPVELKAILTPYNSKWTPKKLQTELIKERRAIRNP